MTTITLNPTKNSLWNETIQLLTDVYNSLKLSRDKNRKMEIRRVSLSISSNIFNGLNRSNRKDFLLYLANANGSCTELQLLVHRAVAEKSIDKIAAVRILRKLQELSEQLYEMALVRSA
ncbi:MAG: four helix bundle protein [Bacteroidales bacterium]|nr:four helix bundle protein [Bacteroidales bacterium]